MILSEKALEKITDKTKRLLAAELGVTEVWIKKCLEKNKNNGLLTTATSIAVIVKETSLKANEILEEKKEAATA